MTTSQSITLRETRFAGSCECRSRHSSLTRRKANPEEYAKPPGHYDAVTLHAIYDRDLAVLQWRDLKIDKQPAFLPYNHGRVPCSWAQQLRLRHWGQHLTEAFPQVALEYDGIRMSVMKEDAVFQPMLHPMMIRPGYEDVLSKLLDNLANNNRETLAISGPSGTGE